MKQTFYSNGKLLITGEYVVLDGAKALALPTKYGQNLTIEEADNKIIHWKSFDHDGSVWFECEIPFSSIIERKRYDEIHNIKNTLIEILYEAYLMNTDFINNSKGYRITTELTFPKNWGLGTSSTLINNIAQWLKVDPYTLLRKSFGGSGYDLACAQNDTAIIYQLIDEKPVIENIHFHPDFTQKIFFVYLNRKQSSKSAIASYLDKQARIDKTVAIINNITKTVAYTKEPKEFALALLQHEIELSNILELQTIQEALFEDFRGVIKSLGAWGGDFVLAISKEDPTSYFKERGFDVVIPYEDMIL
ncbi:GYDIA family GHMP kinase [Flavobacterium sp. SUN046]|uniref:GYDIA family GHMP kinase n=1 Tax=Flavobacterium sp. SUN046 TaxID=3002440 RepID=UPI002DBB1327|nr:GYDIA family GHMP kinase [Flavobacterium sp. SUN046]MEC4049198.1 GYDIA family GHMP kinase [Flavobacterium sp. SUN046]